MLEASAKYLHVPKYRIYTVEELFDLVKEKYEKKDNKEAVPYFTDCSLRWERKNNMNLKGRHFLTLKDLPQKRLHIS